MEVIVLLLDAPWSWVDTLVPMASDPAWPNRIGSTPFVTATIPAEELFSGVHAALTVPPFPFVILERSDEAGGGDPLFVLFSVQSCRRPGVVGVKNVICRGGEPLRGGSGRKRRVDIARHQTRDPGRGGIGRGFSFP